MARKLKVAVQMDPMETINIDGDSTFALMLEGQARGHELWHYEVKHMALREGGKTAHGKREERLMARARPVSGGRKHGGHYTFGARAGRGTQALPRNRAFGSMASARASPTRCFMPPEISPGRLSVACTICTSSRLCIVQSCRSCRVFFAAITLSTAKRTLA